MCIVKFLSQKHTQFMIGQPAYDRWSIKKIIAERHLSDPLPVTLRAVRESQLLRKSNIYVIRFIRGFFVKWNELLTSMH